MAEKSIRFTEQEILMLRHAMKIGSEDGSLIPQLDDGNDDPEEAERYERLMRKLNVALGAA